MSQHVKLPPPIQAFGALPLRKYCKAIMQNYANLHLLWRDHLGKIARISLLQFTDPATIMIVFVNIDHRKYKKIA